MVVYPERDPEFGECAGLRIDLNKPIVPNDDELWLRSALPCHPA